MDHPDYNWDDKTRAAILKGHENWLYVIKVDFERTKGRPKADSIREVEWNLRPYSFTKVEGRVILFLCRTKDRKASMKMILDHLNADAEEVLTGNYIPHVLKPHKRIQIDLDHWIRRRKPIPAVRDGLIQYGKGEIWLNTPKVIWPKAR